MTNLIVTTAEQLEVLISNSIIKAFSLQRTPEPINTPRPDKEDLISRLEAAELLQISLPTLGTWTKKGYIQSYRMHRRIYYKRNEVIESLTKRNFIFNGVAAHG